MKHDTQTASKSARCTLVVLTAFTTATLTSPPSAEADPVDNPGSAQLYDGTGPNVFFTFSTTEHLSIPSGTIDFLVDSAGASTYVSSSLPAVLTLQSVGLSAPISAQVFIEATPFVTGLGTIDLSGANPAMSWTMVARVRFSAAAAGVNIGNCATPTFNVVINGNYEGGVNGNFTIPAIASGCNGHSAEISGDFGLGSSGSFWTFNKWYAQNIDSAPVPLRGS